MTYSFNKKTKKGFTIIELVIVVAVIGILVKMALLSFGKVNETAKDALAIDYARAINAAKSIYSMEISTAASDYSAQATDQERYSLIRGTGPDFNIRHSAANLSDYQPMGYSYSLGITLFDKVTITKSDGSTLNYE